MKSRPIIMRADEVRAILDGRKTQLRRPIKPQPETRNDGTPIHFGDEGTFLKCPHGQPGDRLWVRETWRQFDARIECACYDECFCFRNHGKPIYRADYDSEDKWSSSVHMPRWASRITLEIVRVRVERVRDITEEDAKAEGIIDGGCFSCGDHEPCACANPKPDRRDSFANLWQSIYGTWDANPWVWVVEFRRVEK